MPHVTEPSFLTALGGPRHSANASETSRFIVEEANADGVAEYGRIRHQHFVEDQSLFVETDRDEVDASPDTIVLVARSVLGPRAGEIIGGVRVHPVNDRLDGWWAGSRLATTSSGGFGVGAALVRAACSRAEAEGAIRFDACAQPDKERFFTRLGWVRSSDVVAFDSPHVLMHWPIKTFAKAAAHKSAIGRLVSEVAPGGNGWVGDDGAPIAGTDVVGVSDAILPAMVERDPWWAGWCSVLVNVNDLTAMGATPLGLFDSIGARTESMAGRVIQGLEAASQAWAIDVLGGHTQLGVHGSLSVAMVGRTTQPVPGGGGAPGQRLSLIADVSGQWRPGYTGRQWDSTSSRTPWELRALQPLVAQLNPAAAKDVSMAGVVGTAAMLAEASGVSIEIDVDAIPRPNGTRLDHWLSCFPGYAMLIAHDEPIDVGQTGTCLDDIDGIVVGEIGRLGQGEGVNLRWSDGYVEQAVGGIVTGLGPSGYARPSAERSEIADNG